MILKSGLVFTGSAFEPLDLAIENGKISAIGAQLGDGEDLSGCRVLPGLIDIHTHGCAGYDFDHADDAQLAEMLHTYASHGVTGVLATLMTNPKPLLLQASAHCGHAGGVIKGIYLEGPFFGPEKKGAHREDYLLPIDNDFFEALDEASGGNIRVVAVDPCLPGADEFIRIQSRKRRVSLAHSPADFEQANAGFSWGATQVTHLFNAMTGLHHRKPGMVGAAFAGDCLAEMICDGIHIHPAVLKTAMDLLGDRALVISDSMAACGLADGMYSLGGQQVTKNGRRATLADGTLAGSVTFAWDGMVQLIRAGVAPERAVAAATAVPARSAGISDTCGSIRTGRAADLVVADADWNIRQVYLDGKPIL